MLGLLKLALFFVIKNLLESIAWKLIVKSVKSRVSKKDKS